MTMLLRGCVKWTGALVLLLGPTVFVRGYIHFPPLTLAKMCKDSHHIRVLKVEKSSKEQGVIVFQPAEILKGRQSKLPLHKHVIPKDMDGAKPILDWLDDGQ